ncbi:MAG TPA: peptidoglycan DD-metalloendopeptidase family protein [Leptolyngbya sp.]|nr:peptidoglycan DD-metalloendopeptidase family protein [Leptolyngbya sp.]
MKRAVPQDANSVPFSVLDCEKAEEHPRQTLPEANRTVRTSAAMFGLAFSVGAYGLAAPQQANAAIPTEPTASDLTPNAATPTDAPSVSEPSAPTASTTTHIVQEGQTLWKIAELYGIDATKLANLNSLQTNAVLSVGQTLQVPAGDQTVAAISGTPIKSLPNLKSIPVIPAQPKVSSASQSTAAIVVKRQQTALEGLKQNRDRLKQSLAELKSEEPAKSQTVAVIPQLNTPNVATYRVNPGETLSSIAQAHGISPRDLANLNRISNPNLVRANQFIQVPQKIAQSPVSQPVAIAEPQAATVADIQIPTVPSLASTQNPVNPNVPVAIGGDASQFAYTNPSRSRASESQTVDDRSDDRYVNALMSDISRLREQYQSRSTKRETAKVSAPEAPLRPANPQFTTNRPVAALRTQSRSASPATQTQLQRTLANSPKPKPQTIAVAPAGSESYAPILRSSIGKTVSPNLPSLGVSDAYMPGDRFKGYMWPAKGVLTSPYGWRWGRMHKGIDIAAPVGTPVMAAATGKVVFAGWNDGGYGNLVEIKHPDGSSTLYAHNSRVLVRSGQEVRQGQQIAEMGSTGFSTGPHSHFEVHLPGRGAVNPIALLPQSRG